jgi:hypothetical protein
MEKLLEDYGDVIEQPGELASNLQGTATQQVSAWVWLLYCDTAFIPAAPSQQLENLRPDSTSTHGPDVL